MKFSRLKNCMYFESNGFTYNDNGLVSYTVNRKLLDHRQGQYIEHNGQRVASIFHYADEYEFYIQYDNFVDVSLPLEQEFQLFLVSVKITKEAF